jgi:pyruvate dehydrogenase E1 component
VIPDIAAVRLKRFFADAGWHVAEAKYGRRLTAAFDRPGGAALEAHIDAMPNEAYQHLFTLDGPDVRRKFLVGADPSVRELVDGLDDGELKHLVTDLGGHDLGLLLDTFRACDAVPDRPSVVFAYTIKGFGLPIAGDPMNHAALLSPEQIDEFRAELELDEATEWDRFDPDSEAGQWCRRVGGDINNSPPTPKLMIQTLTVRRIPLFRVNKERVATEVSDCERLR